jgi:hypothetical protein
MTEGALLLNVQDDCRFAKQQLNIAAGDAIFLVARQHQWLF